MLSSSLQLGKVCNRLKKRPFLEGVNDMGLSSAYFHGCLIAGGHRWAWASACSWRCIPRGRRPEPSARACASTHLDRTSLCLFLDRCPRVCFLSVLWVQPSEIGSWCLMQQYHTYLSFPPDAMPLRYDHVIAGCVLLTMVAAAAAFGVDERPLWRVQR